MSEQIFNEPAFPITSEVIGHWGGMGLRDYFAAKAMQGLLSNNYPSTMNSLVVDAYEIADLMMKARYNVE